MEELISVEYRMTSDPDHGQMHSHDAFEIYMFHHGKCRYLIHQECYELLPGDILLMNGMTLHKPNVPAGCEYVRSHVHFSPEVVKGLLETIQASEVLEIFESCGHFLIRTNDYNGLNEVETIFKRLSEVGNNEDRTTKLNVWENKLLIGQLLIRVHALLREVKCDTLPNKRGKTYHAERITQFIQNNFHEPLTISTIAKQLNLNKSYISHVFKEITGFTVMEYVMACRLKHAKYLLETDWDKSIKQIAYESGFENPAHFSRFFKEKQHLAPKDYRKQRLLFYQ
ncbi:AraC family transcriptional regulator [Gracilibacillus alcaliphilus]|uniref:AraC family transcriptional regulator n=1 Tax=Gracilibacillus alcaliphilus TaxID=1401441 RepID=UPI0019597908|nr:AraC family transcriptional regulator [Gracilibacillus alcaliphilus]MBM7679581.1 AraC-like DNA-binding protein [Gracilibacillus alcaliphilus]